MSIYSPGDIPEKNLKLSQVVWVDPVGGYILANLEPWKVWNPGLKQLIVSTPHITFLNADFQTAFPRAKIPKATVNNTASYNLYLDQWVFPPATLVLVDSSQSVVA